jgi:hypothetical protein
MLVKSQVQVHRYHVSNPHRSLRKRLTAANEDYIEVHALPGRPLQVDGDKKSLSVKRVAANREDRIRSHDLHKRSTVRQYLVRVQHPITPSLERALLSIAAGRFSSYLPFDTFAMALDDASVDKLLATKGVIGVYTLPADLKVEHSLFTKIKELSLAARTSAKQSHNENFLHKTYEGFMSFIGARPRSTQLRAGGSQQPAQVVLVVMLAFGSREKKPSKEARALMLSWHRCAAHAL